MKLAEWSVKNRVGANIVMAAILIAGLYVGLFGVKRDLFPDVTVNFLVITTLDRETNVPEDVERRITIPIEDEVASVEGITRIISNSEDNFSTIFLELEPGISDIDPVLNDVRQQVAKALAELPATAEQPIIENFEIPLPLCTFGFTFGEGIDREEVRPSLERIRRALKSLPGVSDILVDGLDRREIWVEIDPLRLENSGMAFSQVVDAVRRKNVNISGGRIEGSGGEQLVRIMGEITDGSELEDLPVRSQNGQITRLSDLGSIYTTSERDRTRGRVNLQPAVTFTVVKKKGADVIDTVGAARRLVDREKALLPKGVDTIVITDATKYIQTRINTVLQSGIIAILLITTLLMLFLSWQLALLIGLGLVVSVSGCFLALYAIGGTINLLSLFGMIMALGMVVDDALVIGENVYRHFERGLSPVAAAIRGTQEVMWPVIGSVATTVAAFLPLMLAEGVIGQFLVIVPVVVISALVFSLVQAFIVLPSHLADTLSRPQSSADLERQHSSSRGFRKIKLWISLVYYDVRATADHFLNSVISIYLHLLQICLRWRYLTVSAFILILMVMGAIVGIGAVRFQLFAIDWADQIFVKVELPPNASLNQTEEAVAELERAIVDSLPPDDLRGLSTRLGARFDETNQFLEYGTNIAMIIVDIDEQNPKCRRPSRIIYDLKTMLNEMPAFVRSEVKENGGGPPVGRAVNIEIRGESYAELLAAARDFEARLNQVPGVFNVGNNYAPGKTEHRVVLDEAKAMRAGVDASSAGQALQAAFQGIPASRMRWGNDEVIVRVKMSEQLRGDPDRLMAYKLINDRGETIPLSSIAEIQRSSGLSRIVRRSQDRAVIVSADVRTDLTNSVEVNNAIKTWLPELETRHPTIRVLLTGENEDTEKSVESMKVAALVAFLLIYVILAFIFNSFIQPVIIMTVIPFGIVGVILGLLFTNQPLGLMSIMGTIALSGIVVNNSVVFIDFMNSYRRDNTRTRPDEVAHSVHRVSWRLRWHSILISGRDRFRPIFLTTATTVGGLWSLANTTTGQEQFLAPMAQAIVFGLVFATTITMLLIPCLYAIVDDFTMRFTPAPKTP
jgi:multidrug efflux pump subunit AcrB